eukprot:scaffold113388_cov63-Phaeocystis_antarctica.AAC.2
MKVAFRTACEIPCACAVRRVWSQDSGAPLVLITGYTTSNQNFSGLVADSRAVPQDRTTNTPTRLWHAFLASLTIFDRQIQSG